MIARTTVRLAPELLARAKRKAAKEGRTLTALIEDGLRIVTSEEKPKKQERVLPRVSTATGGLQPGIDLTSFSDYQSLEDLEYAERLNKDFK